MLTVTVASVVESAPIDDAPVSGRLVTSPKPLQKMEMNSPRLAGRDG